MDAKQLGTEAAFPAPGVRYNEGHFLEGVPGLTKREYFAGLAIQGAVATEAGRLGEFDFIASRAVDIADALLAELAKEMP